jgi:hypothetical protein
MDKKLPLIIIIVAISFLALCVFFQGRNDKSVTSKEHYGGPIINVKKLPMTDCYDRCVKWSQFCEKRIPDTNNDVCYRVKNSCMDECYYSNAQRM